MMQLYGTVRLKIYPGLFLEIFPITLHNPLPLLQKKPTIYGQSTYQMQKYVWRDFQSSKVSTFSLLSVPSPIQTKRPISCSTPLCSTKCEWILLPDRYLRLFDTCFWKRKLLEVQNCTDLFGNVLNIDGSLQFRWLQMQMKMCRCGLNVHSEGGGGEGTQKLANNQMVRVKAKQKTTTTTKWWE